MYELKNGTIWIKLIQDEQLDVNLLGTQGAPLKVNTCPRELTFLDILIFEIFELIHKICTACIRV